VRSSTLTPPDEYLKTGGLAFDIFWAELEQRTKKFQGFSKRIRGCHQLQAVGIIILFLSFIRILAFLGAGLVWILLRSFLCRFTLGFLGFLLRLLGRLLLLRSILPILMLTISPMHPIRALGLIVHGEIELDSIQRGPEVEGVLADPILPSDHVDVGPYLAFAQREAVEVKLVFLPDIENVEDCVVPLERQAVIPSSLPCLAILGQEPYALHIDEISQRTSNRFRPGKQAHRRKSLLVLVIP